MTGTIKCPLCAAKFGAVVALDMHCRSEHPGAVDANRDLIRRAYRKERIEKKQADQPAPGEIHPRLKALYHDCPCGRSYADHVTVAKQLAGVPA